MTNHPTQAGHTAALPADLVGDDAGLVERLTAFAQGCRGSMWQSRDETIQLMDQAAIRITELSAHVAQLDACKWDVRHTGTMNDLVQMGMARDAAIEGAAKLQARVAQLEAIAAKLAEYAGHADACVIGKWGCEDQCFCGLTQALTEYKDATDAK